MLTIIMRIFAVIAVLLGGLNYLLVRNLPSALSIVTILIPIGAALWLLHRGHMDTAAWLFVSSTWVLQTGICIFFGGVSSPAFPSYLLVITIATLALRPVWGTVFFAALSFMAGGGMALAEMTGVLPEPMSSMVMVEYWLGISGNLILILLLLLLARHSLLVSLGEAYENERRFRGIFNSAHQIIGLLKPDGTVMEMNRNAIRLLPAQDASILLGRPVWEAPWWRGDEKVQDQVRTAVEEAADGRFVEYEIQLDEVLIDFSLTPILDEDHNIKLIIVEGRDITEQKQAEQRYRTLFQSAPAMYVLTEKNGLPLISECNQLFLERLGYERDEVIGRSIGDFYTVESQEELYGGGYERAISGEFLADERTLITKDGRRVETVLRALPRRRDGEVVGTLAMFMDISQRKEAEREASYHAHRLRVMHDANLAMSQNLQLDTVLQTMLDYLGRLIPYDTAAIFLREDTRMVVQVTRGHGAWVDPYMAHTPARPLADDPLFWRISQTRRPVYISDVQLPHTPGDIEADEVNRSWLGVPLLANGELVGIFTVTKHTADFFTPEAIRTAESLAAQAAATVQNAQLHHRLQAYANTLEGRVQARTAELTRSQESLKYQKEVLQSVLNNMADGVVVADEEGEFLMFNPSAKRIVGQGPFDAAPVLDWPTVYGIYQRDRETPYPPHENPLAKAIEGVPVDEEEVYLQNDARPDGAWLSLSARPLQLTNQRRGTVIVIRDVTEKKRAQRALTRYAATLQAQNEDLDAFAQSVAHDLKTPLGVINNYAEFLKSSIEHPMPDDDMTKYVNYIMSSSRKAISIVDELLLLASVRSKDDLPRTAVAMDGIVREAIGRLEPLVQEKQAEIVMPDAWPTALGYGPWVEEVWTNYLSNALKYGDTPVRIELGVDDDPDSEMVHFWVSDNGPGISAEERPHLFEPFFRAGNVAGRAEGTGLGLSIVKRIVERLGGNVAVESEIDRGSTFIFTLPKADATIAADTEIAA